MPENQGEIMLMVRATANSGETQPMTPAGIQVATCVMWLKAWLLPWHKGGMLQYLIYSLAALILCFSSSPGMAAPKYISLPPETAKLKKSGHPGYQVALQKCTICHSADYISLQPPGMSLRQWTDEVSKMKHAFGAPIRDDEVSLIGEYLAPRMEMKIGIPVFPACGEDGCSWCAGCGRQCFVDPEWLLCCHAVDRKVVGPAS